MEAKASDLSPALVLARRHGPSIFFSARGESPVFGESQKRVILVGGKTEFTPVNFFRFVREAWEFPQVESK